MLKTFISIIVEISNKICKPNTPDEHNVSIKEEGYDGGLGEPYNQRKWAENYYGKQFSNKVLKEDIDHL